MNIREYFTGCINTIKLKLCQLPVLPMSIMEYSSNRYYGDMLFYIPIRNYCVIRCQYGHCQMMDIVAECVCCQEIPETIPLNEEEVILEKLKDPLICITYNPGFWAVYVNPWVIRTPWYQYK